MTIGKFYGITIILLSSIGCFMAYDMFTETGSVFKFLIAAPVFLMIGIAMLIFPGYHVTLKQSRNREVAPDAFYKQAPKLHKIIWAVAGVAGFIASMVFFKI